MICANAKFFITVTSVFVESIINNEIQIFSIKMMLHIFEYISSFKNDVIYATLQYTLEINFYEQFYLEL